MTFKEIKQPVMPRPDLENHLSWAFLPRVYCQWSREVAPQLEIDVPLLILGNVLSTVTGDDVSFFNWASIGGFNPEYALQAKQELSERLDWEITTPETPPEIQARLVSVLKIVSSLDWSRKEEFEAAQKAWMAAKEWIEQEIKGRGDLNEALACNLELRGKLSKYWDIFLHGQRDEVPS